jgi:hypothetical protein
MRSENLSEHVKKNRYEYSRLYKERQRREAGVPVRKLTNPKFDSRKLSAWLEKRITVEETKGKNGKPVFRSHLNGKQLTTQDADFIRHLRYDSQERVSLKRIDQLAVRYDLPLWELEEFASRYKLDIRTLRRRRNANRTNPTNS